MENEPTSEQDKPIISNTIIRVKDDQIWVRKKVEENRWKVYKKESEQDFTFEDDAGNRID